MERLKKKITAFPKEILQLKDNPDRDNKFELITQIYPFSPPPLELLDKSVAGRLQRLPAQQTDHQGNPDTDVWNLAWRETVSTFYQYPKSKPYSLLHSAHSEIGF